MSGKTMEVSRELLERVTNNQFLEKERISIARHEALFELRGLLAKTACIDCKETGFCLSIMGDEIRCPCHAPIQFAKPDELQAEPAAQPQGDGVNWKVVANEQKGIIEQQQNLIASLRAELSESYRIDSKPHGEPLIHITPEVLAMLSGERKMQPGGLTYSGSKPLCGWTVPLYTEQPAPVADSTTSDKYKAELYEEVWQKARDMGFANVSMALAKLSEQSQVPELTSELRWILGQMCFQHIHTAQALRTMGHQIARKAEDEQAVTIYWMLGHYLKDPLNWRQNAIDEMKAAAPAA